MVHHGVKWKPQKYISTQGKRAVWLKNNDISLYTAHAPLDLDKKYGHNIGLARMFNLKKIRRFGKFNRAMYGFSGRLKKPMKIEQIAKKRDILLALKDCPDGQLFASQKARRPSIQPKAWCCS
ncbi:MAG: Nif3-like dinuclear metal center hexameric protein [Candidatus Pacearchaeota archaeon]|nr:Nif3-like dinuclear metal center hexameric protein [Candidatus Pacearchaeota archaeon]